MNVVKAICACAVLVLGTSCATRRCVSMMKPACGPGCMRGAACPQGGPMGPPAGPGMAGMCPVQGPQGGPMGPAPGQPRMMGPMMQKQVVPTDDGGVVVVIGNKVVKYDKNLNKVGEAEIEISEQAMQDMQAQMDKCCKMMMMKMSKDAAQKGPAKSGQ